MTDKEFCKYLAQNDDEYIFLSVVCDKISTCKSKNILTMTKFLDTRQRTLTVQLILQLDYKNYVFDGGLENAERVICLFLPDYPVEYDPFKFIRAGKSKQDSLTHRDYLGSLMGLQIKRECIGDIFVHENGADIVVMSEIAEFIMLEYKKAGRKQLSLSYISSSDVNTGIDDFTIIRSTVPSMRLDVIVGSAFRISRSESAEFIKKGRVLLNAVEFSKPDKTLGIGDRISIRGKGKAEIISILGKSKKDRIILEIKKYGR